VLPGTVEDWLARGNCDAVYALLQGRAHVDPSAVKAVLARPDHRLACLLADFGKVDASAINEVCRHLRAEDCFGEYLFLRLVKRGGVVDPSAVIAVNKLQKWSVMAAALGAASLTADAVFDGRTLLDDTLETVGSQGSRVDLGYAQELIKSGARITSWSGSLLVEAVEKEDTALTEILLCANADVNKSWCGAWPIHRAAYTLNFGLMKTLLNARADVSVRQTADEQLNALEISLDVALTDTITPERREYARMLMAEGACVASRHAAKLLRRAIENQDDELADLIQAATRAEEKERPRRVSGELVPPARRSPPWSPQDSPVSDNGSSRAGRRSPASGGGTGRRFSGRRSGDIIRFGSPTSPAVAGYPPGAAGRTAPRKSY
jgi:hypothetical protein